MRPFIIRTFIFAAERVRMICLALTLVLLVKTAGAVILAGFNPETDTRAIAQAS